MLLLPLVVTLSFPGNGRLLLAQTVFVRCAVDRPPSPKDTFLSDTEMSVNIGLTHAHAHTDTDKRRHQKTDTDKDKETDTAARTCGKERKRGGDEQ